jgi:AraC-like DNA-binding protein
MSYREHAPPPSLAPWLDCIWERRGDGAPVRVLPDGCIDIVWTEGADTQLVGANTSAFVVAPGPGVRVVGARFRPGGAPAFLGLAAEGVRDLRVGVEEVWAGDGERLAESLDGGDDPLRGVLAWLEHRLCDARRPDPVVGGLVQRLRGGGGAWWPSPVSSLASIADQLGVSDRQLRRRVLAAVGYGPKRLSRVLRLWRALEAARAGDELARAAFDAGYVDQAHFANECRLLAGVPATAMLAAWTQRDRFLQDGGAARRDHPRHD